MDPVAARRVVSFVVPAWNEERWLPSTLQSIHDSARALGIGYEVIVADDGSTDRTREIATKHRACVVEETHRQISATRNAGARAATGEFLIFVDADTRVNPAVVRAAIDAMRAGAVGGGAGFRFDGLVPLWARVLLRLLVFAFRRARLAAGCFFFVRRRDFEAVAGFDERLYAGEEIELTRTLKRRGGFVVLREQVETSARKLRAYGSAKHLRTFSRLALLGERGLLDRSRLDLWYEGRRDDPAPFGCPETPAAPQARG